MIYYGTSNQCHLLISLKKGHIYVMLCQQTIDCFIVSTLKVFPVGFTYAVPSLFEKEFAYEPIFRRIKVFFSRPPLLTFCSTILGLCAKNTSLGSVVILIGNKLTKLPDNGMIYDSLLHLVVLAKELLFH